MKKNKPLIIANWKQYLGAAAAVKLFRELVAFEKKGGISGVELIVAPPILAITEICKMARVEKSKIKIAAQDCGLTDTGAHTGAVSPRELRAFGVAHVIIGHSERRAEYGETDALIAKKISAAVGAKLIPIVCVGETASERAAKKTRAVVGAQIRAALSSGVSAQKIIFAYEPRWAIGTGTPVAPGEAAKIHEFISGVAGAPVRVCYGGSVSPENIGAFIAEKNIAGVLVGGASAKKTSLEGCIKKAV